MARPITPEPPLFGTVEWFVEKHHARIAAVVRLRLGKQYNHKRDATPESLRLWVLNDPELYAMALADGMKE